MRAGRRALRIALFSSVTVVAVAMRAYHYSTVFRNGTVVLIQLDPYRYRFQVERVVARAQGAFDVKAYTDPGRDDLLVASLGWIAELFGGGTQVVGTVLAVYPVVVAILTCPIAYLVARRLAGDWRAGITAVALLAIFPGHVYRTALGFSDHHAFDYLWLALTFFLVVAIVHGIPGAQTRRRRVLMTGAIGSVLAAQTLAWTGSPLLVAPYVLFTAYHLISVLRSEQRPATTAVPLVGALAIATGITALAVWTLSWQSPDSIRLLLAPALVLAVVAGLSELGYRRSWQSLHVGVGLLIGGVVAAMGAWWQFPAIEQALSQGIQYFVGSAGIVAEATSLYLGDEPLRTVLAYYGLLAVPFVPALLVVTWRAIRDHRPGWLALSTYTWYFLGLTAIQRRFIGEFALFGALTLAVATTIFLRETPQLQSDGHSLGDINRRIDIGSVRPGTLLVVLTVGTFILATTILVVPMTMDNRVVDDAEYESTQFLESYATEQGLHLSNGYVFSARTPNLMYNYFAHGEEVTFGYAADNYPRFAVSDDSEWWYQRLTRRGTGFVVVGSEYTVHSTDALHTKLQRNLGSRRGKTSGLAHYRLLFRSSDQSQTVYTLVPGANITGTATPGETVPIRTTVSVPNLNFTYSRSVQADDRGRYHVTVPYSGSYTVEETTVTVPQVAIDQGNSVSVPDRRETIRSTPHSTPQSSFLTRPVTTDGTDEPELILSSQHTLRTDD